MRRRKILVAHTLSTRRRATIALRCMRQASAEVRTSSRCSSAYRTKWSSRSFTCPVPAGTQRAALRSARGRRIPGEARLVSVVVLAALEPRVREAVAKAPERPLAAPLLHRPRDMSPSPPKR